MLLNLLFTVSCATFFYDEWKKQFDDPTETFLSRNPESPLFKELQALLETKKSLSKTWCQKHTCITSEGALKCFEKTHDVQEFRKFWRENLTASQGFFRYAQKFLRSDDHRERINRFLYKEQNPLGVPVDVSYLPILKARQKCLKGQYHDAKYLAHTNDPGLLYSLILCLKKTKTHEDAIAYLKRDLDDENYIEEWGNLRAFYGRYLMERGRYHEALRILEHIHPKKATDLYANLEFLKGLAFYLNCEKKAAYRIWLSLHAVVKKRILKAQTAYWLSRCQEREKWLHVALKYPLTFYGEIASYLLKKPCITPRYEQEIHPYWARVLLSLPKSASRSDILAFIEIALTDIQSSFAADSVISRVQANFGPFYAVWISKKLARYLYVEKGYPVLDPYLTNRCLTPLSLNHATFKTFLHALIRQESLFDPSVKSCANAIGLTQLLPSTAKLELPYLQKQHGVYVKPHLVIPYNNVTIGACHLNRLLSYYNNNFILAAAAYNAGKNRVNEWLKERSFKKDALLWIEMIPFSQTREYVKKLTENVVVYGKKFHLNSPLQKIFPEQRLRS